MMPSGFDGMDDMDFGNGNGDIDLDYMIWYEYRMVDDMFIC